MYGQIVTGIVIDAQTGEPLPGVAVEYNQSAKLGTVTDIDGYFEIPNIRKVQQVVFSFIGYTTLRFAQEDMPRNGKLWEVKITPETEQLNEVEVIAGENPALRIIKHAIKNREANNPNKYPSYTYRSYNKNVLTYRLDLPDTALNRRDSIQFVKDTLKAKSRHILVIESVTEKFFKAPNKEKENIIGTKISGFKHPGFAATPDGIQNFAFHTNTIPLVNKKFLNPIANGADKHYVYILKDTLYENKDTIFIMDYWPEKGANFEGFKGELSIHTKKWALVHFTAYPYDKGKVNLFMEQFYEFLDNKYWFPVQMNFELELEKVPLKNTGAVMIGKTFLDSIQIDVSLNDDMFNHLEVDLTKEAAFVDDEFWAKHRTQVLTIKEQETYRQMDSIGDKYKFDALLNGTRKLYDGYIVTGKFDLEFNKIFAYNQYEGVRLGLGIYTNEKISEKFSVGGYFGYGFRDFNWKYGGRFRWYFDKPNDFYFTLTHINDVRDPGGIRLKYIEWSSIAEQFLNTLMDRVEQTEASLSYRAWNYSKFQIGLRHFYLLPTYNYIYHGPEDVSENNYGGYKFTEAQVHWRWMYKEKFTNNWGQRISSGSDYPIVNFIYSRGISDFLEGEFEYNKFELGILFRRYTKNLGKTRLQLEVGLVDRPVPWSMNFNGRPSYNSSFSVVVRETFQTMRFNEFSSSQYAALFFMHDFGPLLLRTRYFKPEFRIFQSITYGTLRNQDLHEGIPFKTLEQGFYESGGVIDNIIRVNILNVGYLGLGAGVFYRYGANHFANEADNWTFKFAFMYSVN